MEPDASNTSNLLTQDPTSTAATNGHQNGASARLDEGQRDGHLTGILSRRGFLDAYAEKLNTPVEQVVVHLDLEGFQTINHHHGFDQGDEVLRVIAQRLVKILPGTAAIGRTNGDEFVMMVQGDRPHGEYIAKRAAAACNEPIPLRTGGRATVNARAGWASGRVGHDENLVRFATLALHEARTNGTRVGEYNPEIASLIAARGQTEIELRTAVVQEQFILHGQPIVDTFEDRVEAIELLLRWRHPEQGLLAPGSFLPVAEECDFVDDIDRWVVGQLCTYAALTHATLHFSINMSMRSISKPSNLRYVLETLGNSGVANGRLHIDIAQSEGALDVAAVSDATQQLTDAGIGVAIDNFGHGYASLATLMQMSVTAIKLDRSLTALVDTPDGRGVVGAILSYAKKRGLNVVGAGVETASQSDALRDLGCRYQQGYFFQPPGGLDEILTNLVRPAAAR